MPCCLLIAIFVLKNFQVNFYKLLDNCKFHIYNMVLQIEVCIKNKCHRRTARRNVQTVKAGSVEEDVGCARLLISVNSRAFIFLQKVIILQEDL